MDSYPGQAATEEGIDRPDDMTSPLVLVHHDERTRASKCFYMTALPGLYTASAVDVFSMDGPAIYAPEFHRLPFLRAVEHDLFSDYNVVVLVRAARRWALQGHLASAGGEINLSDAARIIGCWCALGSATSRRRGPRPSPPRTDQTTFAPFGYEQLLSGAIACNSAAASSATTT